MYDYINTYLNTYITEASYELYKLVDVVDVKKLQEGVYSSSLANYSYTTL